MSPKPFVVIIPGAFHTPFHYRKISAPLIAKGYEVIALDFLVCAPDADPNTTYYDDAAAIQETIIPLFDQGRQAVVISHSYGSLPACATVMGHTVAERAERGLSGGVAAVINMAGFVFPVPGKGIAGDDQEVPPPDYHVLKDGITHLQEGAKELFFTGLSEEEIEVEYAALAKTQTRKSITTFPKNVESQIRCPKTYFLCEDDKAVPAAVQESMASLGGYEVVRFKSGHAPFLTIPGEVVAAIEDVAMKVST